jgi:hypothetical protein
VRNGRLPERHSPNSCSVDSRSSYMNGD